MSNADNLTTSAGMKFLVVGAGAIGAYIGARMARAGFDVTLFARGPHLAAMQQNGVQVKSGEGDFHVRPRIVGSLDEAGPADVVLLGVKAHSLPALAPRLAPILLLMIPRNGFLPSL